VPTANELLFDASVRHQIGVRRFQSGEVRRVLTILEKADRELTEMLRLRLIKFGDAPPDFRSKRFGRLLADVRGARKIAMQQVRTQITGSLVKLAPLEVDFEQRMIRSSVPVEFNFAAVETSQLRTIVFSRPFQGRLLREWYMDLAAIDRGNLRAAIQLGMSQGESIPAIVRRVAGTRARNFTDGALAITRRKAETIVRTAVNHVSNRARETMWDANSDVISAIRWTAMLDGRTTPICRARDGTFTTVGGRALPAEFAPLQPAGARPPAHMACRSVMIAAVDGVGIVGQKPFVRDTRTRRLREVDFRKIARNTGKSVSRVRREWISENIGTVPSKTTYNQFLKRQPAAFQDQALGQTKGKLFRKGELDVDKFVDVKGNELTLTQLADSQPEAFVKAGLKPEDFN